MSWYVDADGKVIVEEDSSPTVGEVEGQGRLFQANRYSPITVAMWLRYPPSLARSGGVASALGKVLRSDRTFAPLRGGRDALAVVVQRGQRKAIMSVLGWQSRYWREFVEKLVRHRLAHRCDGNVVICLLIAPADECPYCGNPVEQSAADYRARARSTTALDAVNYRAFEHESGDATRGEQGDTPLVSSSSSLSSSSSSRASATVASSSQEGSSNSRPTVKNASDDHDCAVCGLPMTRYPGMTDRHPMCGYKEANR